MVGEKDRREVASCSEGPENPQKTGSFGGQCGVTESFGAGEKQVCKGISVLPVSSAPFQEGAFLGRLSLQGPKPHPGEQWVRGREAGGRHPPNTEGTGLSQGSPQGDASAKWLSLTLSQVYLKIGPQQEEDPGSALSWGEIPLNGLVYASSSF